MILYVFHAFRAVFDVVSSYLMVVSWVFFQFPGPLRVFLDPPAALPGHVVLRLQELWPAQHPCVPRA